MNIFIPYSDIHESVQSLDDKRIVKMTVETAQLISTAIGMTVPKADITHTFYKVTHKNHPCAAWARHTNENYLWLLKYGFAIANEYTHRYGKVHKSSQIFISASNGNYSSFFPAGKLMAFPNCAANKTLGIDYTGMNDVHAAYQLYLKNRWLNDKRPPKWTKRDTPVFA